MAGATDTALVSENTPETEAVATGVVGLVVVLLVLSLAPVFELVTITNSVVSAPMVAFLGGLLVVLGFAVVTFGVGSRPGYVATDSRPTIRPPVSGMFGLIWFVVGGLIVSQILGLRTAGWVVALFVTGGAAFAVSVPPHEDIGSMSPAGALAVFVGTAFLAGVTGPSWLRDLGWEQQAPFNAEFAIPVLMAFCSLFIGWAAAKAYGGFGARGRHIGAYVLVYLNAISTIALLFLLVAFTVLRDLPGLFKGLASGAGAGPEVTLVGVTSSLLASWPFVMNGVTLLDDVNGILPVIAGTIWPVVGAVLSAVPPGIGAAVFITEYADRGCFVQAVEIATNDLWSTSNIVLGLFGLMFLVPRLGNQKPPLAGMLTLGFVLLLLVVIMNRESMPAVPDEYRDASAAFGVTKWQTVRSIVFPAALPGIVTGIILGVGRIAGETAPIPPTMPGGVAPPGGQTADVLGGLQPRYALSFVTNPELMQVTSALLYQLYSFITAGVGRPSNIGAIDEFRWATALILLVVILGFYAAGIATRHYFRSRLQHE